MYRACRRRGKNGEKLLDMLDMGVDKETIFHLLNFTVLNSFLLLTFCGARMTDRQFRLALY
jgi:hypothetical protein